ncbi:hypothetical protein Q1695_012196 [Nippostrongylus brasiliensis]|nr:hypothetical protein Q1695_012196 [Nippostrongylus brasiliensis]
MLALIDTGAGITVASQALLSLLGVFELQPSAIPSAIGMAGIPIRLVGCSVVSIRIGDETLDHPIHFTETQCIPSQAHSYNIILGNDILCKLPSWSVDYANRVFRMGSETIRILSCSVPSDPHPPKELVVRSAQTMVLPPGTETLVPCYVAQVPSSNPPLMASASVLDEDNIFVAPAVFFNNKARLLVSNPSSAARIIYRNQRLSEATLLHEASDGTLSDDGPCF